MGSASYTFVGVNIKIRSVSFTFYALVANLIRSIIRAVLVISDCILLSLKVGFPLVILASGRYKVGGSRVGEVATNLANQKGCIVDSARGTSCYTFLSN